MVAVAKVRSSMEIFTDKDIPSGEVFKAHGTDFLIPDETVGGIPLRERVQVGRFRDDWTWSNIKAAFVNFWSGFGTQIWFLFVEALWIPSYRPEWGKYKTWNYQYETHPRKTRKESLQSKDSTDSLTDKDLEELATAPPRKVRRRRKTKRQREKALQEIVHTLRHDPTGCEIIRFNVAGMIYETQRRTLNEFPDTLLGNPTLLSRYWDPIRKEYFFDRHRKSFEAILYFYQSGGTLLRPLEISLRVFEDEIKFYQLGSSALSHLLQEEGVMNTDDLAKPVPRNLLLRKLWFLIEYPESSPQAQFTALFSVYVVLLSTFIFCLETLPVFNTTNEAEESRLKDPLSLCETVCVVWFTIEFLIRLIACPQKMEFLKGPMNIVDILSILPFYVSVFSLGQDDGFPSQRTKTLVTLRIFRLFRVFRVFKLSRHSAGLQVLGKTLRASIRELALLIFFLLLCVIIFSSLVYFAELSENSVEFDSIPDAFWWGLVTITSLGYGDKVPRGITGRAVGSLCAIAAILTIALPIPVFVNNFNYFYQRETQEEGRRELDTNKHAHVGGCPYLPECPLLQGNGDEDGGSERPRRKSPDMTLREIRAEVKNENRNSKGPVPARVSGDKKTTDNGGGAKGVTPTGPTKDSSGADAPASTPPPKNQHQQKDKNRKPAGSPRLPPTSKKV